MKAKQRRCSERTKQEREPSRARAPTTTPCCVPSVHIPPSPPLQSQWHTNITIFLLMDSAHRCRAHRQVRSQVKSVDSGRAGNRPTGGQSQKQGAEAFLPSSGFWPCGRAKECGTGRGARGSHRRRPLPRARLTADEQGARSARGLQGCFPSSQADLRLDGPPAKRCSPTRGRPMLLAVGSREWSFHLSPHELVGYHAPFPSPPSTNFHHTSAAAAALFRPDRKSMIRAGP